MKFYLLFYLMFFLVFSVIGQTSIALIGIGEAAQRVADLAIAEFASEFLFVERQGIDDIISEVELQQKFAENTLARKISGATLLAVIKDENDRCSLTIFETNYGFKLVYKKLSIDDISALQELRRYLNISLEKHTLSDSVRFVSIAGVRNNLHYSLADRVKELTDKLIDKVNDLNVVILEREYLLQLLQEKRLSGKWQSAVAASEVLHFELNQGVTAKNIVIGAHFINPLEEVIFSHEEDSATIDWENLLFEAINKQLMTPKNTNEYTLASEAQRFVREAEVAQINSDYLGATQKYFAAFVLDNENPKYLTRIGQNWSGNIAPIYPYWRIVIEKLTSNPKLLQKQDYLLYANNLLQRIKGNINDLSTTEKARHWALVASIIETLLVAGEEINDELELSILRFKRIEPAFYPTKLKFIEAKDAEWRKILTLALSTKKASIHRLFSATHALFLLQENLSSSAREEWTKFTYQQLESLALPLAKILQANNLLYSKNYTEERILKLFDEYFAAANQAKSWLPSKGIYYSNKVMAYPGLLEKIKSLEETYIKSDTPVIIKLQDKITTPLNILTSCRSEDGKDEYVLTFDNFDYIVKNGNGDILTTFPRGFNDHPKSGNDNMWILLVDDLNITVAIWNKLWHGKRGDKILFEITKIPFVITTVRIDGERIIICGKQKSMSVDFFGKNRIMHTSSTQAGLSSE